MHANDVKARAVPARTVHAFAKQAQAVNVNDV
jgi:hypothetical protein